jgi:3-deoxy-D-manno-octulosonic-acid transferase
MNAVAKRSPVLALYRLGTMIGAPLARLFLRSRLARGKEDGARIQERFGKPDRPRPEGPLVWIHAASVGESISVIPLVNAILADRPDAHVLMTTGTVTSARLMAERLPARAFHQFAPVDLAGCVAPFLDHWRPDLAIWVEQELWPNMILETVARDVPMALVNARLSDRSFATWRRAGAAARQILQSFSVCLVQDEDVGRKLSALGAREVVAAGNLKFAGDPLPFDADALAALQLQIGSRPCWLAASTHEGEEAIAATIHTRLAARHRDILTIIAPRHPERGDTICAMLRAKGLHAAQRSRGEAITPDTAIYVADTLGEMGVLYRAAPLVFMGGSLVPHGGQNPLEPARLGCAVLSGPYIGNFQAVYHALSKAQACQILANSDFVADALMTFLGDRERIEAAGVRAKAAAGDRSSLVLTMRALRPLLTGMPVDARS